MQYKTVQYKTMQYKTIQDNAMQCNAMLKKYKTFFIQLYQHEWKLKKREIVWKHDARRVECFHTISSFSNFHEC